MCDWDAGGFIVGYSQWTLGVDGDWSIRIGESGVCEKLDWCVTELRLGRR